MSSGPGRGLVDVDAVTPAVLVLPGPVSKETLPRLCDDVRALIATTRAGVVVCDVGGVGPPTLATIDVLARMQLAAIRAGGRVRLRGPGPELRALIGLVGLRFEVEGEAEQREPPLGVEEAVEPGDPAV
ncbi:STAS domain-containing protein [Streptomyces sp. CRN 30]|uniref:STAS domain-containing protein n=1 Tax=Streptomyces sp. CRN 30 TaxID=3075613 RepID=UPI002A809F04|nr:STAS domain-containing protein [Streptomyces sp. CRN 30]